MRQPLILASFCAAALSLACASKPAAPAAPPQGALSGLVAQRIVVTPLHALDVAPELGWSISRQTEVLRQLDADIYSALEERGVHQGWVFPEALRQSHTRNPTYTVNPNTLAMQPLRSPAFAAGERLPEPLATQLRTIVALHDARFVLAPIELRLERAGTTTMGHGVLRLALLDARASEARWVGKVTGDSVAAFGPAVTASVAAKLADLVAKP